MTTEIIASHNLRATHDILAAMAGSKRALELILEEQNDIFALFTDGGQIIKGNQALSALLGKPADVLYKETLQSLFSSESWILMSNKIEILKKHRHKREVSFELSIDGGPNAHKQSTDFLWTITRFDSISNRRGQVYTIVGRDMTEIKRYQRRLGLIFSSLPLAIFQISNQRTVSGPYSAYTEILFGKEQIDNMPFRDLISQAIPNMNSTMSFGIEQLLESIGAEEFWYDIYKAHFPKELNIGTVQHETWLGFSYSPVIRDSIVEEILVVVEDVTDRIQARRLKDKTDLTQGSYASMFMDANQADASTISMAVDDLNLQMKHISELNEDNFTDFRQILSPLHSIKGTARSSGLNHFTTLVHGIEDKLQKVVEEGSDLAHFFSESKRYIDEIQQSWSVLIKVIQVVHPTIFAASFDVKGVSKKIALLEASLKDKISAELAKQFADIRKDLEGAGGIKDTSLIEAKARSVFMKTISKFDKDANLTVSIDKAHIQSEDLSRINEVLTHLISNAIDHGLESRTERSTSSKAEKGTIAVVLKIKDDYANISVEDDGRGIDPEKLVDICLSKGIIGKSEAQSLSREQKLNLLFRPGFSTKDSVSEISGRGVGLDAANFAAMALPGGHPIKIDTAIGRGTAMRFRCKLSDSK